MSQIDRQRREAVATLESLGYRFDGAQWHEPSLLLSCPSSDRVTQDLTMVLIEASARFWKPELCASYTIDCMRRKGWVFHPTASTEQP